LAESVKTIPANAKCEISLLLFDCSEDDISLIRSELLELRKLWPETRALVVISGDIPDLAEIRPGEALPLDGLLWDDVGGELLGAAMRLVHRGYTLVPADILSAATDLEKLAWTRNVGSGINIGAEHPLLARSTARQREVIQLLMTGLPNKEIARRLSITESTVKVHIRMIMDMLDAKNRTQIISRLIAVSEVNSSDGGNRTRT